jgi:NAD(P)-dependent dehydrogenase (short-subunit alcohol dehydrogenase family)
VVTGGGRGIGRAIAAALTAAGARVTVFGRDPVSLDDAVARGEAHAARRVDVTDGEAVRRAIDAVTAEGGLDILVANAGQAVSAPFRRTGAAPFAQMLDVNLMGVVHAAHAVLGPMTERRFGRIVAIASTAGLKGYPYVSAYCAAKHAVIGFVRALALETATAGVTVNAVCPGFTDTRLTDESVARIVAATGRSRDEAVAEIVRHNPQQRLVVPGEVADAVLWLCGEGASAVTGQAIAVAGGEV